MLKMMNPQTIPLTTTAQAAGLPPSMVENAMFTAKAPAIVGSLLGEHDVVGPSPREFVDEDFRDDDLAELRTERVVFDGCDFSGVNMAESEHAGTAFRNCRFDRTTLWHSTFRACSLMGSVFTNCRLRPVVLDEVDLTLAVLGGADLRGVDLTGCRLI